jgi:hypothetical protein
MRTIRCALSIVPYGCEESSSATSTASVESKQPFRLGMT